MIRIPLGGRRRVLLAGAGCYVLVRVLIAASVGPHEHGDTNGYRGYPVDLLGRSPRPWVASALMRIGEHPYVLLQAALSAISFLVLGIAIGATMRDRRVQIGVVSLFALLGLAPRVTAWDTLLLTESLALSLTALLIACLIHIGRVPWAATTVVFALWLFTRDAHVYLGVFVVAGIGVWGWRQRRILLPAAIAVVLAWGVAAYRNDHSIEAFNVTINIAVYVGSDVERFHWFRDHGMPVSEAFTETNVDARWHALNDDHNFLRWAGTAGQRVYAKYLATHPAFLFGGLHYLFTDSPREPESLVDHSRFRTHSTATPFSMPETVGPGFVWPKEASLYSLGLMIGAAFSVLATMRRHRLDGRWIIPGVMMLSTIPHALLAYHATPIDLARHGVVLAFTLVVSGWWMIALAGDVALTAAASPLRDHDDAVDCRLSRTPP